MIILERNYVFRKSIIVFLLLWYTIITGCGYKDQTTQDSNGKKEGIERIEFEKKKECLDLTNKWEKEYFGDYPHRIDEVIYSKKNNSCLINYREDNISTLFNLLSKEYICAVNNDSKDYFDEEHTEFRKCIEDNR